MSGKNGQDEEKTGTAIVILLAVLPYSSIAAI